MDQNVRFLLFTVLFLLLIAGCGTLQGHKGWGQDAIYPVKWERIKTAAVNAALDPVTWVPAAGAAVFAIDDWDHKVVDWAVDKTPIFQSKETANNMSDYFVMALIAETFFTAILTPSGGDWKDWTQAKARGVAVEAATMLATYGATSGLKEITKRDRPDDSDDRSMPSGHISSSFCSARLANRNLDSIEMNSFARKSLKAGNLALASSVAWARVEEGKHFPSDVLVGAALGNFISVFIHDAFMNLPEKGEEETIGFYVEPSLNCIWAGISIKF